MWANIPYVDNNDSEACYEFPEDMERILTYLRNHGTLRVHGKMVEWLYERYSDDCYAAGWMSADEDQIVDFANWLETEAVVAYTRTKQSWLKDETNRSKGWVIDEKWSNEFCHVPSEKEVYGEEAKTRTINLADPEHAFEDIVKDIYEASEDKACTNGGEHIDVPSGNETMSTTGSYINREFLLDSLSTFWGDAYETKGLEDPFSKGIAESYELVRRLPAEEALPVRHGKWIPTFTTEKWSHEYRECKVAKCSACGVGFRTGCAFDEFDELARYCPNCGAKMDGGEEDNT